MKNAKEQVTLSKNNPREFWKRIKRRQRKIKPTCNFDTHFKNLFESMLSDISSNSHKLIDENFTGDILSDDYSDASFTLFELDCALRGQANRKVCRRRGRQRR